MVGGPPEDPARSPRRTGGKAVAVSARDLTNGASPGPSQDATSNVADLQALLFLVTRARREQESARETRSSPDRVLAARWAMMEALETYAAALRHRCWPVPRQIQGEIQLLRALCGVGTGRPAIKP